jgi:hypothetical protein
MAYIHIKSDAQKADQREILRDFGRDPRDRQQRDYAEYVAAKTREIYREAERGKLR